MTETERRCGWCNGPHPVSVGVAEESPYCTWCHRSRVMLATEEQHEAALPRVLDWARAVFRRSVGDITRAGGEHYHDVRVAGTVLRLNAVLLDTIASNAVLEKRVRKLRAAVLQGKVPKHAIDEDNALAVAALEREIETIEIRHAAPPWLSDVAEALGIVRPSDGAPLALNWTQALEEIRDLLDDRDHWKKRAEQAEYALDLPQCRHCGCLVTAHAVDDEERRQCLDCSCKQFEVLDG